MYIEQNKEVIVLFKLSSQGKFLIKQSSCSFTFGTGAMPAEFEDKIEGLEAGDSFSFTISVAGAREFRDVNPAPNSIIKCSGSVVRINEAKKITSRPQGVQKPSRVQPSTTPTQTHPAIKTVEFTNYTYVGTLKDNKPHGTGKATYKNTDSYEGEWDNGRRHGYGMYLYHDGSKYTGDWVKGEMSGKGSMTYANGNQYIGDWANNKRTGKGTFTWTNGDRYEGDFKENYREGTGTYYYASGKTLQGRFVQSKFQR